jgi:hypothetical protein
VKVLRRIRQWWCGRQHDKGYRLHAWEMLHDGKGSIRCTRCGHLREGFTMPTLPSEWAGKLAQPSGDDLMSEALTKARAEGWFR